MRGLWKPTVLRAFAVFCAVAFIVLLIDSRLNPDTSTAPQSSSTSNDHTFTSEITLEKTLVNLVPSNPTSPTAANMKQSQQFSESPTFDPDETPPLTLCRPPLSDPFDPILDPWISHPSELQCRKVEEEFATMSAKQRTVTFNSTLVDFVNSTGRLFCYYTSVYYVRYSMYSIGPPVAITTNFVTLPDDHDTYNVQCAITAEPQPQFVYFDTINTVRRIDREILPSDIDHPSVLIFFLDGVSTGMFQRQLPLTYDYFLNTMSFRFLRGHNKIADNSFPNLMAFLTGKRAGDQGPGFPAEMTAKANSVYDNVGLIWKEFGNNGYATSYYEEMAYVSIFHMATGGFQDSFPADHYFYPFTSQADKPLPGSSDYCYGNTPKITKGLDTWRTVLHRYRGKRVWSMFMFSELSHGPVSEIERADEMYKSFWQDLYETGQLDETIVIAMADHGPRYPPYRHLPIGRQEDRLPFLAYYLPEVFKRKYPHINEALRQNELKITTHYDTHSTMLDILHSNFEARTSSQPQARGISHFQPLPTNRTCEDASIPPNFCLCHDDVAQPTESKLAEDLAQLVTVHINEKILGHNLVGSKCQKLQLQRILGFYKHVPRSTAPISSIDGTVLKSYATTAARPDSKREVLKPETENTRVSYSHITIEVEPGGGRFEALAAVEQDSGRAHIIGHVDRINEFGDSSHCITDPLQRLYCFCF